MAKTRPVNWVRLACDSCFRDDMDGVSQEQLADAIRDGWRGVVQYQTYEESIKTYDDPLDEPPGFSIMDWFTHCGLCPECAKEGRISERIEFKADVAAYVKSQESGTD